MPEIVTVEVPAGVDAAVLIVTVSSVPDDVGVTGAGGLNPQVAPVGKPEQVKPVMELLNPFTAVSSTE